MLNDALLLPLEQFLLGLNRQDRLVLYVLLSAAAAVGFILGRRRTGLTGDGYRTFGAWRFPTFQNDGEMLVSRVLLSHFPPPDYHLMNHVTLRMRDGTTTQVDHILVSRYGVFVIETKNYNGWVFANTTGATWTHVYYRARFKIQNPLFQNYRHLRAVQDLLEFLPSDAVTSVVVFTGDAEFKTEIPRGVVMLDQLVGHLTQQTTTVMSLNRLQFCVGRLETARLAISGETDVEHRENLERRLGNAAVD